MSAREVIAQTRAHLATSPRIPISRIPITCGCISCKRGVPFHCVIGLAAGGGGGPVSGPQTYYVDTPEEAERVRAGRRLHPLTDTLAAYLLRALAGPDATTEEEDAIANEIDAMYKVVPDPPEEEEEEEEDEGRYEDMEEEMERMQAASEHMHDLWCDYMSFTREDSSHRALRRLLLAYVNDSYCARLLLLKPSREHTVERLRGIVARTRFLDSFHSEQSCTPGQPWVQSAPLNRHAWNTFLERLQEIKSWPGYEA